MASETSEVMRKEKTRVLDPESAYDDPEEGLKAE